VSLIISSLVFLSVLLTPEVPWNYSMEGLPSGWRNDGFDFNAILGAHIMMYALPPNSYEEASLLSWADSVLIPTDCDSIILEVDDHYLSISREGSGTCAVYIYYRYYSGWATAWHKNNSTTIDLYASIPVVPQEHLSLHFLGFVSVGDVGSAHLIWGIHELTLTLWCDGSPIEVRSWGNLKTGFDSPVSPT